MLIMKSFGFIILKYIFVIFVDFPVNKKCIDEIIEIIPPPKILDFMLSSNIIFSLFQIINFF